MTHKATHSFRALLAVIILAFLATACSTTRPPTGAELADQLSQQQSLEGFEELELRRILYHHTDGNFAYSRNHAGQVQSLRNARLIAASTDDRNIGCRAVLLTIKQLDSGTSSLGSLFTMNEERRNPHVTPRDLLEYALDAHERSQELGCMRLTNHVDIGVENPFIVLPTYIIRYSTVMALTPLNDTHYNWSGQGELYELRRAHVGRPVREILRWHLAMFTENLFMEYVPEEYYPRIVEVAKMFNALVREALDTEGSVPAVEPSDLGISVAKQEGITLSPMIISSTYQGEPDDNALSQTHERFVDHFEMIKRMVDQHPPELQHITWSLQRTREQMGQLAWFYGEYFPRGWGGTDRYRYHWRYKAAEIFDSLREQDVVGEPIVDYVLPTITDFCGHVAQSWSRGDYAVGSRLMLSDGIDTGMCLRVRSLINAGDSDFYRWDQERYTAYLDLRAISDVRSNEHLPADVLRDRYMVAAERYIQSANYEDAYLSIESLRHMHRMGEIPALPPAMDYFRGLALNALGHFPASREAVAEYLEATGREGRYYREALEVDDSSARAMR